VTENNPVRVIEAFIDELDLATLGFEGVVPETTGRPAYHPATLLKIYLYGYLNRIPSSRRLERESQRNIEVMWLTGHLMPDFKTIADFRKDNGPTIRATCRQFVMLCRRLDLFSEAVIAIDGSRFKAVNTRDKNYTHGAIQRRMEQVEACIAPVRHYQGLDGLDAFLNPHVEAGQHRNEPPRNGLRHQTRHCRPGCRAADGGHQGLMPYRRQPLHVICVFRRQITPCKRAFTRPGWRADSVPLAGRMTLERRVEM
jgi:transposase